MGQSSQLPNELLKADSSWRVVIVQALFNDHITNKLLDSSKKKLKSIGLQDHQIEVLPVAGALEIPLTLSWALKNGFDGGIAIGAVIRGETTHYEYVCNGVERGCLDVQLQLGKPIIQTVLTVENEQQALDRCGGHHGDKGEEAADALVAMLNTKKKLTT